MANRLFTSVLFGMVLAVTPLANAHHSAAAAYDLDKTVEIEGTLVQFSFRSPHSEVTVVAADESGEMQRWVVAWNAARQLGRQGITRDFFRPGDKVVVRGHPGRDPGEHVMAMTGIYREADGFRWGDNPDEVFD